MGLRTEVLEVEQLTSLERGLAGRHIQLLAIGGAIGVGLWRNPQAAAVRGSAVRPFGSEGGELD